MRPQSSTAVVKGVKLGDRIEGKSTSIVHLYRLFIHLTDPVACIHNGLHLGPALFFFFVVIIVRARGILTLKLVPSADEIKTIQIK